MASNYDPEQRGVNDVVLPLRMLDDNELSIIDVNAFDDTADENWLYSTGSGSRRNSFETKIEDLDAWLHSDVPELDAAQSDSNSRRSFDTRTFTRIKKRSNNRLSFENIDNVFSPEVTPSFNVWKAQPILEENNSTTQKESRDSIPMMLRPKTNQVLSTFLSESPSSLHSQASMEAFLNLAKSKEGMSMLSEMSDPDVSSFLMNVSQPSLMYSSIMSDGRNDETIQSTIPGGDSLIDSQILTDSMMEASMFNEVHDTTMLAEILSPHENILNSTQIIFTPNSLNSTRTISLDQLPQSKPDILSVTQTINSENKTDLTFDLKSTSPTNRRLDTTYETYKSPTKNVPRLTGPTENTNSALDATYEAVPNLRAELLQEVRRSTGNKFDSTFTSAPLSNAEPKLDVTYDRPNSAGSSHEAEDLDSTYVQAPSANESESQNVKTNLDLTYDASQPINAKTHEAEDLDSTYVQAPSAHESESRNVKKNLDLTYDASQPINAKTNSNQNMQRMTYANKNVAESQALGQNRFNTYRKDSKLGSRLLKAPQSLENQMNKMPNAPLQAQVPNTKFGNNLNTQRFNTYRKGGSAKNNNIDENNLNENKLDSTFVKPAEKEQSKLQAPRQLSRLPQSFQKSNPNLGSNLRPPGRYGSDIGLGTGFGKGSQSNIANMNTLSRFKSEGRLLQSKDSSELVKGDSTSRSMESIENTESAHSAPDLEDRMSMCSDSNQASYMIKPRNLQFLKKLGSMEETGRFAGSTPKVKGHTVLKNTWVQGEDLPSPVLKNGVPRSFTEIVEPDSRSTSPSDLAEFVTKTSSPITISPTSSEQALNTIGNDNIDIDEKKENIQAADNVQPKQLKAPAAMPLNNATKLRRPSNWTGGAKVANGASSGIPRPASRIPAPKFARPSLK